jgi:3-oxoacyl-[acyl-carrier-protein] synthase II
MPEAVTLWHIPFRGQNYRRRVVVTGLGALTPAGNSVAETWAALVAGRSGVGLVTLFDASPYPAHIAAEVKGFNPAAHLDGKEARRMARCSQLTIVAARQAVADAALDWAHEDRERVGVILGVGVGGVDLLTEPLGKLANTGVARTTPHVALESLANMPAFHVGLDQGCLGPLSTVVTACASGTQAIGDALEAIRRGAADVVLTGGTDAQVTPLSFAGFTALRAVSTRNSDPTRASRPFDAGRDGIVIGEGAAVLVLEALEHALARGARIYAELLGQAASADAYHIAQPEATGAGPARAMRWALADAGVAPTTVDYINAHGTSTPQNDSAETAAIKRVFGEHAYRLAISSTKSMVGHCFGGAGAIEAVAAIMSVCSDTIHPTINYETPDPACDLDYVPNVARQQPVHVALSNSFGFGGQNACLVVGKYR